MIAWTSSLNTVSCYIESNLLKEIENNSLESKTDAGNYCPFFRELITEIFAKRRDLIPDMKMGGK